MFGSYGFLDNKSAYYGLAPLLATAFLYIPFGFGVRKPNKYSELSAFVATLSLIIGIAIPSLVLLLMFMAHSAALGGVFNRLFYYIGIVLAYIAMLYQVGAFFRMKKK
ncbi:MAG: hypothetical protein C3F02_02445 [Parcubacteria group bacterium]|nr:MAG: hypothetical protein C3F02_02445 [Parcubacteria group bacterium]